MSEIEREGIPLKMKQQLHDCVVAFEALLWQTLKGHMADTVGTAPAVSPTLPSQDLDERSRHTIRCDEPPATEQSS